MEFRERHMDFLLNMVPKFSYSNICKLSQELECFNNSHFWEAYEEYWNDFGYDEHFSTWEYGRAFEFLEYFDYKSKNLKLNHYTLILLRLKKKDLLSKNSYSGIDGIYYFLSIADSAIQSTKHRKWVIEGLKWYGQREEIEAFCRVNDIQYPFIE